MTIYYVGAKQNSPVKMCAQALINYWNKNKTMPIRTMTESFSSASFRRNRTAGCYMRTQAYEDALKAAGIDYEFLQKLLQTGISHRHLIR